MRPGLTISCIAHVRCVGARARCDLGAADGVAAGQFAAGRFISDNDFSQLTQGVKNAPKLKSTSPSRSPTRSMRPKPIDQTAPTRSANRKSRPRPPRPSRSPIRNRADKPAKPKPPDYKPDQIAQLLKKDSQQAAAEAGQQADAGEDQQDAPKFNADQVAALLDHREPQREVATGRRDQSDGQSSVSATGTSAQLSQSEIDALRARIIELLESAARRRCEVEALYRARRLVQTGRTLSREPAVVEGSASALGPALAESAKRALLLCQPFTMLKPEHYDQWKDLAAQIRSARIARRLIRQIQSS